MRAAGPSLVDLIRSAAEAAHLAGEYARAAALARRALSLVDADADPMTAALVGERLGRYLWISGNSHEALAECRAAVARLPQDGDPAGRARVLGSEGHLLLLLGRGAEALALCEPALEIARAAGARREEGSILSTMCAALSYTGALEAGIEHGHEAMRIARERNDIEEITRAYVNLGETLDWAGRIEEAADLAGEGALSAIEQGIGPLAALLASDQALRLLRLGRWDDADAALAIAIDAAISGVTAGAALAGRALLDALRGRFDESRDTLDEAERSQENALGSMWTGPLAITRAELALWSGRPDEARDAIVAMLDRVEPADEDAFYLTPVLAVGARAAADIAVAARATGDAQAEREAGAFAATLVRAGAPSRAPRGVPGRPLPARGAAERRHDAGRARSRRRAAAPPRRGATSPRAGTRSARPTRPPTRAGAWPRRSSPTAARAPTPRRSWRRPTPSPTRLRARPLAAELEALATRARLSLDSGVAPAAAAADGDGAAERVGLTARELEVLRLVAAGETNRSIGQALYISEKTVSVHISRILAKLDVRGRVEAAGLALRLGLLEETEAAPEG